ncbi:hypothetical protein AMAG_19850 [Allomyces macrogynus ATCC 38327]|uniref:USP domain-containing protein n=1 Tax=Allomyces macrogynus (strain ATCC 38327) TaxID=578462 RepID=A0A0L0T033_ALLM3|nr:hypothetical protein AMAG_19850 [Allomyces macrogynus ATCC 38327]|eukprot:KNE68148.1 hypothetical protein AMAG_19850 [Allomyces macrogynus ATCC 38327]
MTLYHGPVKLRNPDNITCYLNAALQCFYHVSSSWAIQGALSDSTSRTPDQTALGRALLAALEAMKNATGSIDPIEVKRRLAIIDPEFGRPRQQDAQEAMNLMLQAIAGSDLGQLFSGMEATSVICVNCNRETMYSMSSVFTNMFLSIPTSSHADVPLRACFDQYFAPADKPFDRSEPCPHCHVIKGKAVDRPVVTKWPPILAVLLKRSVTASWSTRENPAYTKRKNLIKFELDSMVPADGAPQYDLIALVDHEGRHVHEGHYTAAIHHQRRQWYSISDERILAVPDRNRLLTRKAYMLIYQQRGARPAAHVGDRAAAPVPRSLSTQGHERAQPYPTAARPPIMVDRTTSCSALQQHPVDGGRANVQVDVGAVMIDTVAVVAPVAASASGTVSVHGSTRARCARMLGTLDDPAFSHLTGSGADSDEYNVRILAALNQLRDVVREQHDYHLSQVRIADPGPQSPTLIAGAAFVNSHALPAGAALIDSPGTSTFDSPLAPQHLGDVALTRYDPPLPVSGSIVADCAGSSECDVEQRPPGSDAHVDSDTLSASGSALFPVDALSPPVADPVPSAAHGRPMMRSVGVPSGQVTTDVDPANDRPQYPADIRAFISWVDDRRIRERRRDGTGRAIQPMDYVTRVDGQYYVAAGWWAFYQYQDRFHWYTHARDTMGQFFREHEILADPANGSSRKSAKKDMWMVTRRAFQRYVERRVQQRLPVERDDGAEEVEEQNAEQVVYRGVGVCRVQGRRIAKRRRR